MNAWFPNLDRLRSIACLSVVFGHNFAWIKDFTENSLLSILINFISQRNFAVSFFFVLSGFLITTILIREKEKTRNINLFKFFVRRSLRIWPLYFLVLLVGMVFYPLFFELLWGVKPDFLNHKVMYFSFLGNFDLLSFVQNAHPSELNKILAPTWSISVEEQFYFLWPLVISVINRKYIQKFLLLTIFVSIGFQVLNSSISSLHFHSLSGLLFLSFGSLLAVEKMDNGKFYLRLLSWNNTIRNSLYILLFTILLFHGLYNSISIPDVLINIIIGIVFTYILIDQTRETPIKNRTDFLSKMGKYTYSIYLLHMIALVISNNLLHYFSHGNMSSSFTIMKIVFSLLLTIPLAWISYRFIETPFLKLKNKFAPKL